MLMLSEVAQHMILMLAKYGDIPCVLESPTRGEDGVYFVPLEDVPVMTVYSAKSDHKENAVLFTSTRYQEGDHPI